MVAKSTRNMYMLYGDSITDCKWCITESDHVLNAIPNLTFQYVLFMIIAGLTSMNWKRDRMRKWVVLYTLVAYTFELGVLSSEPTYGLTSLREIQCNSVYMFRCLIFAAWCIALLSGIGEQWTDEQILQNLIIKTIQSRFRNTAKESISTAVLSDPVLKARFLSHHKKAHEHRRELHHDPDVKVLNSH